MLLPGVIEGVATAWEEDVSITARAGIYSYEAWPRLS